MAGYSYQNSGSTIEKVGKEALGGVFDAIQGIANWVGIGNNFKEWVRQIGGKPSDTQLAAYISKIVAAAQSKGSTTLSKISDRLNSLQMSSTSPAVRQAVTRATTKLRAAYNNQVKTNASIDNVAQLAENQITRYSNATAGDYLSGKAQDYISNAKQYATQAAELADKAESKI